jgi:GNAT superfamily N-acetyltransferase
MPVTVAAVDPSSQEARAMSEALWGEIQQRYGFVSPNPYDPAAFTAAGAGFWVAMDGGDAVGSVAIAPIEGGAAELDVMYVAPAHRARGVGQQLLAAALDLARVTGTSVVRLRAGEPQPEALRFYAAAGFTPIEPFGKWVDDESARCLELEIA